MTPISRDLIVIGGGPAGISAATVAADAGMRVTLLEDRPTLGGQIYKQPPIGFDVLQPDQMGKEYKVARSLLDAIERTDAEVLTGHMVWGIWDQVQHKDVSVYNEAGESLQFRAPNIIIATGAYDRPVPFPGWTLPGVLTAGGAQSMVKIQKVLPGDRILMAGSGPLILAFSCQLHQLGANIVGIVEAAPSPGYLQRVKLAASAGLQNAGLLREGIGYLNYVRQHNIPMYYGHAIARAEGESEVTGAVIRKIDHDWNPIAGTEHHIDVDTVCIGYGFLPSTELLKTLGCELDYDEQLGGQIPTRTRLMETSVPGVYAVGDGSGVAGAPASIVEGRIAALSVAAKSGALPRARARVRVRRELRSWNAIQRFRAVLDDTYRIRPGIYNWMTDDTVICRCEEVTAGEIRRFVGNAEDPNYTKSLTRASMGLCQGRNCSRNVSWLVARETGQHPVRIMSLNARPPAKPVPLGAIANPDADPMRGDLMMPDE
jgi:D-hydroxyproline dehydrogenase subunit alpha